MVEHCHGICRESAQRVVADMDGGIYCESTQRAMFDKSGGILRESIQLQMADKGLRSTLMSFSVFHETANSPDRLPLTLILFLP